MLARRCGVAAGMTQHAAQYPFLDRGESGVAAGPWTRQSDRLVERDPAFLDEDYAIGERNRLRHVMGHQQSSEPPLQPKVFDELRNVSRTLRHRLRGI